MTTGTDYGLDTPNTGSPLTNPSHAGLHQDVNAAIHQLAGRTGALESTLGGLTAPDGDIDQARLAAHEWPVRGQLVVDNRLLLPIIWNLTGRPVDFVAAKASVFTAADADIELDIVIGSVLNGPSYDPNGTHSSILGTGGLVIPVGQHTSATVTPGTNGGFTGVMQPDTYVAAVITQVGGTSAPGVDLTIQLNRLL